MELAVRASVLAPFLLVCAFYTPAVDCAAFVPEDDEQVLATLPSGFKGLRRERPADGDDYLTAISQAEKFIALGRAEADPRYFGYAQAALNPWWDSANPPMRILVLRAMLRQSRHEFDMALSDLDLAIKRNPRDSQAWLTRAMILRVRGDYPEAVQSCDALQGLTQPLVVATCISSIAGLDGRADDGYFLLADYLNNASAFTDVNVKLWALNILAELADARGQTELAEKHFRDAFALGIRNNHLIGSYADFLLDEGRAEEVRRMLEHETAADGNLLRLSLAEQQLASAKRDAHTSALIQRIEANRRRGDRSHLREEARAVLHLLGRADEALELARQNWAVQREPWDARLVLEAALATGDRHAARPVLDWIARTGLQHARVLALAERVRTRQ